MTFEKYEIWYAKVRFEDSPEIKERPVLIWGSYAFIMAYKLTGTDRGNTGEEFRIAHWQEAGLSKPTSIRIHKMLRLTEKDMTKKIGVLDPRDQLRLSVRIAGMFSRRSQ